MMSLLYFLYILEATPLASWGFLIKGGYKENNLKPPQNQLKIREPI